MNLERWQTIQRIVGEVLDQPGSERLALLKELCGDDQELLNEAQALLTVTSSRVEALDHPALPDLPSWTPGISPGDALGNVTISRILGEGGMGTVFLGIDARNEREVAVKVLNPRFSHFTAGEHRILAKLSHPSIATLFESGRTEQGYQYLVMEYVNGTSLTEFCESERISLGDRLLIFIEICQAVAYAHSKLIVHRDLKPANILILPARDSPEDDDHGSRWRRRVKILDFSIARLVPQGLSSLEITAPGDRLLTLPYASPEQLAGELTGIASDIYSLGVLLSVLLVGRLPYPAETVIDLPEAIKSANVEHLSTLATLTDDNASTRIAKAVPLERERLSRALKGDLDEIALKALRREPETRYQSAGELAEDIRRFIAFEPVSARRGSRWYKVRQFLRRNRLAAGVGAVALGLILASAVALWLQVVETQNERDSARAETRKVEETQRFLESVFSLSDPWEGGIQDPSAQALLDAAAKELKSKRLASQPEQRVALLRSLALAYRGLGLYENAQSLLSEAVKTSSQTLGLLDELTAELYGELGAALVAGGENDRGRWALLTAQSALSEHTREAEEARAGVVANLAVVALRQSDLDTAEIRFRRVLEIYQANPDFDREDHAVALANLGYLLRIKGRPAEARIHLQQALSLRRLIHGSTHVAVGNALRNMGALLVDEGCYEEAEVALKEALVIQERVLPPDHSSLLSTLTSLSFALTGQWRLPESEAVLRRALAARLENRDRDPESLLVTMNSLARVLRRSGQFEEAESLLTEALEISRLALGEDHRITAEVLNGLGVVLSSRGNYSEAQKQYLEALEIYRQIYGPRHRRYAVTLLNLASSSVGAARVDRDALFTEALNILEVAVGRDHQLYARALDLWSQALFDTQAFEDAYRLSSEALEGIEKSGLADTPTHAQIGLRQIEVGLHLNEETHDLKERARHFRDLVCNSSPEEPSCAEADGILALSLVPLGRYSEAESLLLESLGRLQSSAGPGDRRTLRALKRLEWLYRAWNRLG